ncbi:MAG: M50 family metallopeptidase [Acidimicrobiales bacterium]
MTLAPDDYTDEPTTPDDLPRGAALLTSDSGGDAGDGETNPALLVLVLAFFGFLGWLGITYLLFVLALVFMIFLHELGHFLTARWTGMKATQFFIGFGPTVFSFRRGETEYGLKAIPAGAFVRIIGMNNLDPVDPADEPRAYRNASYPRRMLVITAGSLMHFAQAVVVFALAFSVFGVRMPENSWTISTLSMLDDGSPAPSIQAGLETGDRLVSVDGVPAVPFAEMATYIQARPGETVTLEVARDADGDASTPDEVLTTQATLASLPQPDGTVTGFLGVGPTYDRSTPGVLFGVEHFADQLTASVTAIPQFFSPSSLANLASLMGQGSEEVDLTDDEAATRPVSMVGVVRIAGDSEVDWIGRLLLFGSINVFVGAINLVPLLPLDGGHAAIGTYERLRSWRGRRHHADVAKLMPLTYAVVGLLGFIFVSTVWLDIFRPIS